MRKTIILATFIGIGAGAVGVGAVPELMKGSDTLFDITNDVVNKCLDLNLGVQPLLDINYIGTGSGAGESAITTVSPAVQHVAPMSRFLQKASSGATVCVPADPNASASKSEGINFGLDGISIVASKDTGASTTCNGTLDDCDRATEPSIGLAKTRALNVTINEIVPGPNGAIEERVLVGDDVFDGNDGTSAVGAERILPGPNGVIDTPIFAGDASRPASDDRIVNATGAVGGAGLTISYTFDTWKDVLKIVYGGRLNSHGWTEGGVAKAASTKLKECDSNVRHAIVENYGNLFQVACATGGCTQLHHAFRRDDVSGTTDTFITLLGLTNTAWIGAVNSTGGPAHFSSFCNGFSQDAVGSGAPPCDIRRDPQLEAGVTAAYDWDQQDFDPIRRKCRNDEKVCGRNGTLGVVLPILPTDFLTGDQAFPPVQDNSAVGFKVNQTAPKGWIVGRGDIVQAKCPNGGQSTGSFKCIWPQNDHDKNGVLANQLLTVNEPHNRPTAVQGNEFCGFKGTQADGRIYNEFLRNNTGAMLKDTRSAATTGPREIYGAFYRIHQIQGSYPVTADANTPDGGPIAGFVPQCVQQDATNQIGCLASVSKCSIGFAGRTAVLAGLGSGVNALNVDELYPTDACVQKLLTDVPNSYPISRRLWLNTTFGFETASLTADERAMAQCFSNRTFMDGLVTAHDFVTLGSAPVCVDFNETPAATCGTANTDACANNGGIALDPRTTTHGSAIPGSTGLLLP